MTLALFIIFILVITGVILYQRSKSTLTTAQYQAYFSYFKECIQQLGYKVDRQSSPKNGILLDGSLQNRVGKYELLKSKNHFGQAQYSYYITFDESPIRSDDTLHIPLLPPIR